MLSVLFCNENPCNKEKIKFDRVGYNVDIQAQGKTCRVRPTSLREWVQSLGA